MRLLAALAAALAVLLPLLPSTQAGLTPYATESGKVSLVINGGWAVALVGGAG